MSFVEVVMQRMRAEGYVVSYTSVYFATCLPCAPVHGSTMIKDGASSGETLKKEQDGFFSQIVGARSVKPGRAVC